MVSPLRTEDRLDTLAADVRRLRIEVVEREREAGELLNGEDAAALANVRADATRLLLSAAKDRYIDASEEARAKRCPVHGLDAISSCGDCCRIWGLTLQTARVA